MPYVDQKRQGSERFEEKGRRLSVLQREPAGKRRRGENGEGPLGRKRNRIGCQTMKPKEP